MTPDELGITQDQYSNLSKLADLLETVDQDGFDMKEYAAPEDDMFDALHPNEAYESKCGTVACAAGHLVKIVKPLKDDTWNDFIRRATGIKRYFDAWDWLFSEHWKLTDNTALGASKRIKHFLEKGVPVDWEDQMDDGNVELCY